MHQFRLGLLHFPSLWFWQGTQDSCLGPCRKSLPVILLLLSYRMYLKDKPMGVWPAHMAEDNTFIAVSGCSSTHRRFLLLKCPFCTEGRKPNCSHRVLFGFCFLVLSRRQTNHERTVFYVYHFDSTHTSALILFSFQCSALTFSPQKR